MIPHRVASVLGRLGVLIEDADPCPVCGGTGRQAIEHWDGTEYMAYWGPCGACDGVGVPLGRPERPRERTKWPYPYRLCW